MDRKGKQKISFICLILVEISLFAVIFFCKVSYEKKIYEDQGKELSTIYPEFAEELGENISYYAAKNMQMDFWIMLAVMLLAVIVLAGTFFILTSANKQRLTEVENELNFVYEQLLSFQNGNMDMLPLTEKGSSQKFGDVYDKLRELGYYFSDLKVRLAHEENSTKALITDISHQLKTPLASIKMSHELSLSSDLSEEERQSFLETKTQEILKMEVLLDELVKLSRLENSMIQITCETCSIKKTISEAVSQIYIKANAKDIEICVDMEKDMETPHDHKWTVEALANILENAVKYSASGTTVNICVSCLVNHVLIQVEDEGIGIPEGEGHEIFKRFYRGSNAKDLVKEGAGVGLYLARSIIEQQGGTIVAKRKNGSGTIFQIMLPLSDNEKNKALTKL
ncbi:MAG: HAMP domain-containing sensor histidine kinase [Lachnospiraceae bacterium]|nr:HAMP domain-containing sensor histidine kinase [Lachnospiraceae bacterium]MDY4097277.1 HAMP domain-containing sensor histidine kinase [Lachnospiraceae bacterium]